MDRQQIATSIALREVGEQVNLKTFNDRLIMQKTVYLLQEGGVNLGYYFSWYLRGPYSRTLTSDLFEIEAESGTEFDDSEGWRLDKDSMERLEKTKGVLPRGKSKEKSRKLELLASVHFAIARNQVKGPNPVEIEALFQKCEKDFSQREIEGALGHLQQYGLLA